ncbi:hypothetical protein BDQ12DRAFT_111255 [Crucibulum laeve]|uniref:Uncharacterized protein n=1 Tax=Crucibulum laeve TaxID=68775 RepID=A0A5C3M2N7_9AGAR|nr:hypothetical protein BDQ12DRAFT_111255 [Crucibulum laeve]
MTLRIRENHLLIKSERLFYDGEVQNLEHTDLTFLATTISLIRYQQLNAMKTRFGLTAEKYDIRLLLDTLPSPTTASSASRSAPASPSGWSDLPSDTEDTFFFSPEEAEDFHREKRRKLIEKNREERLKARLAEDGEEEQVEEEEVWGGSDEEPEPTQKQLMERTAVHLLTSPNPAQLEMRILANHGKDKRFAFLRGRWSRMWRLVKGKARMEKEQKESEKKNGPGLGGLDAYGDSDDNDDSDAASSDPGVHGKEVEEEAENLEPPPPPLPLVDPRDDDAVKALRRQRAKEWADKRRAEKADKI